MEWWEAFPEPFSQSSIAFGSAVSLTQSGTGNQTYSTTLSRRSRHRRAALTNTRRRAYTPNANHAINTHSCAHTQLQYTQLLPITLDSLIHTLFFFFYLLSFSVTHSHTHPPQTAALRPQTLLHLYTPVIRIWHQLYSFNCDATGEFVFLMYYIVMMRGFYPFSLWCPHFWTFSLKLSVMAQDKTDIIRRLTQYLCSISAPHQDPSL